MPLVLAGVGIEHNHAVIHVAVGDVHLVGRRIHDHIRGPADVLGVVAAAVLAFVPDLEEKLAVPRELQQLRILRPASRRPDIAFVVDVQAVLVVGPFVAVARTAKR